MKKLLIVITLFGLSFSAFAKNGFTIVDGPDGPVIRMENKRLNKIKDFSTDGCSSFPDGFIPNQTTEWLDCCIIHDIDYWIGGEYHLKKIADENLGYCVSDKAHPVLGIAMDWGVFVGGAPSPLPWRWGYGWDYDIEYDRLDETQLRSAASKLNTIVDAVIKEKPLLTKDQRHNISLKINSKIMELLGHIENEDTKSLQGPIEVFIKLRDRVFEEFVN